MNVGDYGKLFRMAVDEDISAYQNNVVFKDPNGRVFTRPAQVGTENVNEGGVTFEPNRYVFYSWQQGDLHIGGTWQAKVTSEIAGTVRDSTVWVSFEIGD